MKSDPPVYRPSLSRTWWLRNRRYFLFMLRDFTPVPIALWLIWLLFAISNVREGAGEFEPWASPWFVALSIVCLAFALLHSVTWLKLSGVILRVPLGERTVDPRLITAANFAIWVGATVVVGALLVGLGR
jgi:fumarate reductase subunit C